MVCGVGADGNFEVGETWDCVSFVWLCEGQRGCGGCGEYEFQRTDSAMGRDGGEGAQARASGGRLCARAWGVCSKMGKRRECVRFDGVGQRVAGLLKHGWLCRSSQSLKRRRDVIAKKVKQRCCGTGMRRPWAMRTLGARSGVLVTCRRR